MNLIEVLKMARFLVEDRSCFRQHKMKCCPHCICCEFRELLLAKAFIRRYRSCLKGNRFSAYVGMETTVFLLKLVFCIPGFFQFYQSNWRLVWEITLIVKLNTKITLC